MIQERTEGEYAGLVLRFCVGPAGEIVGFVGAAVGRMALIVELRVGLTVGLTMGF
jgi:hypothetical protein